MPRKIKTPAPRRHAPEADLPPLAARLVGLASPMMELLGPHPGTPLVAWALGAAARAWNAARAPTERAGLSQLDRELPSLVTPAFPDARELATPLETIFHNARVRYPRDPRFVLEVHTEPVQPSHRVPLDQQIAGHFVDVVVGIPRRQG